MAVVLRATSEPHKMPFKTV